MQLRTVERTVKAQAASDGAGVRLHRSIGTPMLDHLDPFLLLDGDPVRSGRRLHRRLSRPPPSWIRDCHIHAGWQDGTSRPMPAIRET